LVPRFFALLKEGEKTGGYKKKKKTKTQKTGNQKVRGEGFLPEIGKKKKILSKKR